jgi:zinc protease
MKRIAFLFQLLFIGLALHAQDYLDINTKIPVDDQVTIGQLENGLTYYIRPNSKPENKIELRLVVNAGSILETEEQLGLAHFMEHMNFNGTKNFAHNELVDYLQSIGVKFGQHLNAYTSFDETVYILPIPSEDPEIVEKGFDILEDWAFNCLLTPEEIEKERGVVLEELRLGLGADKRMMDRYLPKLMYGSQYAERLPIGKKEVLETFDHSVLEDFYKTWYRPDLMAVVVVGDITVEDAKMKIEDHFGKYENPKDAPVRKNFMVPNHEETFVAIESDPEAAFSRVQLVYKDKGNAKPNVLIADYREDMVVGLFNTMINNRLDEIANNPNPPYTYGYSYHGSGWARTKEAYQSFSVTSPEKMLDAFETLVVENERVKRHGFTEGELERAKKQILSNYERMVADKDKTESARYTREYVYNFLEGEIIPGIEAEYRAHKILYEGIGIVDVDELIERFIHDDNRVVIFTGPEGGDMPVYTEEQILAVFAKVESMDIEPYEDEDVAESLMETMPEPGSIAGIEEMPSIGVKKLELSNGATVYYKKTDFKDNEILFRAYSPGGSSLFEMDDYKKTAYAMDGVEEAGMGGFKQNELAKMMADKQASASAYVSSLSEGLRGSSTVKDLETLFQMIYLKMTAINEDEEAYQTYVQKQTAMMNNLLNMPQYWYMIERVKMLQKNNPRFTNPIPGAQDFEGQDYALAHQMFSERFANASDFTFFFVGSFEEDQLQELCVNYLAALPSTGETEEFVHHPYERLTGKNEVVFNKGTDPKSMVDIWYYTMAEYDPAKAYYLRSAGEILTIKLIENLREGQSGVYGVGARGSASMWPEGAYYFSISFPCGPENAETLKEAAIEELNKLKENGPEEKDLAKIKEAQRLELKEDLKENRYWMNSLETMYTNNMPFETIVDFEKRIEKLSATDIQKALNEYVNENVVITMLMPEEQQDGDME